MGTRARGPELAGTAGPDEERIRAQARAFIEREIPPPVARRIDREDVYPHDLLHKFGETGLWGVNIPEAYGGLGGKAVDALPIYEELSRRLPVLAWVVGNVMLYGNEIVATSGSEAQKEAYLPALARGELLFSFALTEPDAGSDAANISTKAVFREGAYWINGSKMFITGAGVSDVVVTLARTGPSRYEGITAFLVETDTPGYSARPLQKLGYHGSNTCAVYYDDVRVPPENILGGEAFLNQGWGQMVKLLNGERLALAACSLGVGQAVLEETVAYAKKRYRFQHVHGRYQAVQHTLVEMATRLEAARRLTYHASALERAGAECLQETSMAKYFASETAKALAMEGLNLMGKEGVIYTQDVQRFLRDVLVLSIGGGTTQIQKNIIAKRMGL